MNEDGVTYFITVMEHEHIYVDKVGLEEMI